MSAEQLSLNLAFGKARKIIGIARAALAVDPTWRARADYAIAELAETGEPFTAEDVRAIVGDPPGHPNAMGGPFVDAARRGLIQRVGYRQSSRPSLHAHPISLWLGVGPCRRQEEGDREG